MELIDQMMTYMAVVCAFPAINDLSRAAVAWTKQIPILNSLPLNEKRSTVRPSDRQVLSSELNSALRSELQVLGALQALLNLIRLSRKEHTPLTPRLLTLHWHRRSWIFFWLMCKVLLSAWLQRSIPPANLSSANWRNVLRTKTISVT